MGRLNCMMLLGKYLGIGITLMLGMAPLFGASTPGTPIVASNGSDSLFGDDVVARGKGVEIKRSQVEKAFTEFKASLAAQGQSIPEAKRAEVERQVLERLVHVKLLSAKAIDADKQKAREAADKAFEEFKKRWPTEDAFNRQLISLGMAPTAFRAKIEEESLFKEVIDRELKASINVTDEEAKKFYDENGSQFELPERVKASHIMILTQDPLTQQQFSEEKKKEKRQLAEKVLARARAGEDFAQLAREFSDDPKSRDEGGDLGIIARGRMVPEFDMVAFALNTGAVSDIVSTKFGLHIIKVTEKLPARKTPYDEAEKDIKSMLAIKATQKQLPDYLKKLRDEAGVVFTDK